MCVCVSASNRCGRYDSFETIPLLKRRDDVAVAGFYLIVSVKPNISKEKGDDNFLFFIFYHLITFVKKRAAL